ncbi:MAG TPA: ATP phosphoribosyltransferase regulatory subunit [Kofleriaceae bacterium]|nr:ATP phosphoribosyltransferase regulatory subunit [Kofleriaceae bacterium]
MQPSPIRLPSGVRDFLPRAAARRRSLAARVMDVFEAWTYARVITPVFECADVLERGLGEGARAAAIRFVEPGTGEIVALRPDITPQIARLVATRFTDVPGPIRLCYEGTVTRLAGERGQREIVQAGIEHVAETGELARAGDAEVLAIACDVLARLELAEVGLDLGHVAPARYVLDAAPDAETRRALGAAIARKDRAGVRAAARVLPRDVVANAHALVDLWGPADEVLAAARALTWPTDVLAAFDDVAALLGRVRELASTAPAITLDFSDLRGEGYYTGIRFAAYAGGAHDAILRGGRYDELIARYGRPLRATGFAIDLEMVADASRGEDSQQPLGVAIASSVPDAPAIARALRARGVRAVVQANASPQWLAGAGLDAFVKDDRVNGRTAGAEIQAARAGDIEPLIALIKA